jgi:hypothetical protein
MWYLVAGALTALLSMAAWDWVWRRIKRGPVTSNDLLAGAGLPRPETLLVGLLALRLAKLPDHDRRLLYSDLKQTLEIGEMTVEIHWSTEGYISVSSTSGRDLDWRHVSICLNEDEKRVLLRELLALRARAERWNALRLEAESQNASLALVEGLLAPVAQP